MNLLGMLSLGFLLGVRHATDADHVVAVTTIISREHSVRAAMLIGGLWGLGHALTILIIGAAIIHWGLVIPERIALLLELGVAFMLVLLGVMNLAGTRSAGGAHSHAETDGASARGARLRPLVVGVVHGLAGSAAVALLVLATIRDPFWASLYLLLFGVGTVIGMMLLTTAMAVPIAAASRRLISLERRLVRITGLSSILFGIFLAYQIGFVDGLFLEPGAPPQ